MPFDSISKPKLLIFLGGARGVFPFPVSATDTDVWPRTCGDRLAEWSPDRDRQGRQVAWFGQG